MSVDKFLRPPTWTTADGRELEISKMETSHLFYCVRMVWNHSAPEAFKLRPFKRYLMRGGREYWQPRLSAMVAELRTRENLLPSHLRQLDFMALHSAALGPEPKTLEEIVRRVL